MTIAVATMHVVSGCAGVWLDILVGPAREESA